MNQNNDEKMLALGISRGDVLYFVENHLDENPFDGVTITEEDWGKADVFLLDDLDFFHARDECMERIVQFIVEMKSRQR